jgi:flagellar hook protein FlgE
MSTASLFNTSVMGMAAQASALGAVAENIANSGTVGYKEATTQFSTMLSGMQANGDAAGGVVAENKIDITAQGNSTTTTSTTDLAIEGSGFFVVANAAGETFLTRSGSFLPDSEGRLVNSAGYYLMGYDASAADAPDDVGGLKVLQVALGGLIATPSTEGTLEANLPSNADVVASTDLPSTNSASSSYTSKTSVTAYDNLGSEVRLDVYFAKTDSNSWEMTVFDASTATDGGFPYSSGPITTQSLSFSADDGSLTSGSPTTISIPGGADLTLDISGMTQLADDFSVSDPTINGNPALSVSSLAISDDGTLKYTLANGQTVDAYKIPLANVPSTSGLLAVTGNVFAANVNSGTTYVGTAGTGSFGDIKSSRLEASTVDLATQLSNMIVAQRSYTANTQVFQTASQVMQTLNNLS